MRMMLAYGARVRRTRAPSAQLGLLFSVFGAVDASFQIVEFRELPSRLQKNASEVLRMLLMRSS